MKEHILIEKAYRYPAPIEKPTPKDCTFQENHGYWVNNSTGEVMMLSNDPRRPQSKKCDLETGEDQKGE